MMLLKLILERENPDVKWTFISDMVLSIAITTTSRHKKAWLYYAKTITFALLSTRYIPYLEQR